MEYCVRLVVGLREALSLSVQNLAPASPEAVTRLADVLS